MCIIKSKSCPRKRLGWKTWGSRGVEQLTMGTFMKIMSTPGDIEDTMEGLCEEED